MNSLELHQHIVEQSGELSDVERAYIESEVHRLWPSASRSEADNLAAVMANVASREWLPYLMRYNELVVRGNPGPADETVRLAALAPYEGEIFARVAEVTALDDGLVGPGTE